MCIRDRFLVFYAQARIDSPPGYGDLYTFNFRDHAVRNLSDGFPGTFLGAPAIVELGNTSCLLEVGVGTHLTIAREDLSRATLDVLQLGAPLVRSLQTNLRQTGWVFLGSGSDQPTTLYFTPALGQAARVLATPVSYTHLFLGSAACACVAFKWSKRSGREAHAWAKTPFSGHSFSSGCVQCR